MKKNNLFIYIKEKIQGQNILLALLLLIILISIGALIVPGFSSSISIRSMLLLAAFLGLASLGQTLCALLGGIDLSIPYVIGSANILLASLLNMGLPPTLAIIIILLCGIIVGLINGLLSYRLQGQSIVVTLGVGFIVVGISQIFTSSGVYGGNVLTQVPQWIRNMSSFGGSTFGFPVPPVVFVWLFISIIMVAIMSRTLFGRSFYAVGGNKRASSRILISEFKIWNLAYAMSGFMSAMTGMILLGFSGGGYVGVGDPYLFTTIAAVVIGGTSLLGGQGGYGSTVVGALVLTVLTSLLVGLGLSYAMQQSVFGLLIVPMVALYARSSHIRDQI